MLSIGQGSFFIEGASIRDGALRRYAKDLFADFDLATREKIPLADFGLHLDVEQGSVRGHTAIITTLGALYIAIGQFGEFVHGVKEIAALGKAAVHEINKKAPKLLGSAPSALRSSRVDAGTLTQLARLFDQVGTGQLTSSEATRRALELLGEEGQMPAGLEEDVSRAVRGIRLNPHQLELLPELTQGDVPMFPAPKHKRAAHPESLVNRNAKLRVEIDRDTKNGRTVVRVKRLPQP